MLPPVPAISQDIIAPHYSFSALDASVMLFLHRSQSFPTHIQIPKTNQHVASDTKRVSFVGVSAAVCRIIRRVDMYYRLVFSPSGAVLSARFLSYYVNVCQVQPERYLLCEWLWKLALVPVNSSSVCIIVSAARHTQEHTNKHLYKYTESGQPVCRLCL